MAKNRQRTLMGSDVLVLFSDVNEAREFTEEATTRKAVIRVRLVRPVARRRPLEGKVVVEVDNYSKPS